MAVQLEECRPEVDLRARPQPAPQVCACLLIRDTAEPLIQQISYPLPSSAGSPVQEAERRLIEERRPAIVATEIIEQRFWHLRPPSFEPS
jgi:hypothetical protein